MNHLLKLYLFFALCTVSIAHGQGPLGRRTKSTVEEFKAQDSYSYNSRDAAEEVGDDAEPSWYPSYGQDYSQCDDGCPTPQPADDVTDAYLKYYSFVWTTLAASMASSRSQSISQSELAVSIPFPQPTMGPAPKNAEDEWISAPAAPVAAWAPPARPAPSLNFAPPVAQGVPVAVPAAPQVPGAVAPPAGQDTPAHGSKRPRNRPTRRIRPFGDSSSADSGSGADSAGTMQVHPAAVADPGFLFPTSPVEGVGGFQGTTDQYRPTDQALAVGPNPDDPEAVLALHCVNTACEIFNVLKNGRRLYSATATKIHFDTVLQTMGYTSLLLPTSPQAMYDEKHHHWFLSWSTGYLSTSQTGDPTPVLLVCSSQTHDPFSAWTCWTLMAVPLLGGSVTFCPTGTASDFFFRSRASYSHDGFFIGIQASCVSNSTNGGTVAAVYAFSKSAICNTPVNTTGSTPKVYRATYMSTGSWYYSLPNRDKLLTYDPTSTTADNPFVGFITPSRPQSGEDDSDMTFVMGTVSGDLFMSIAKLTSHPPLDEMTSRMNAPKIYAAVINKGADFNNVPGYAADQAVIPQPSSGANLLIWNPGAAQAMHHRGLVYIAMTEFFGEKATRTPSIYWAVVEPSYKLCQPHLKDWGMVASADGLALAYPVIAACQDGGAFLAYAYGSSGTVRLGGQVYPAYAGVASTHVGGSSTRPSIDVVKRGDSVVAITSTAPPLPWGTNSAIDVYEGCAWFAVCAALSAAPSSYGSWINNIPIDH